MIKYFAICSFFFVFTSAAMTLIFLAVLLFLFLFDSGFFVFWVVGWLVVKAFFLLLKCTTSPSLFPLQYFFVFILPRFEILPGTDIFDTTLYDPVSYTHLTLPTIYSV